MPAVRLVPPAEWPTLGWQIIDWIESYLCHGPGDIQGERIELDDEFCQFILDAYRLFPPGHERAGERVVTFAELSRPKGRAKSELAGAIVCVEFCGPARFSHWGDDGEPVGKRVRSPFIRCLATEENQAGNTYDNVQVMLTHAKETHGEVAGEVFSQLDVGKTRVFLSSGGEIRPSTASAGAKDGGKETFAVGDEEHLYVLPETKSMKRTVLRNLRKRKAAQPWYMSTTTQFAPGEMSCAEETRMAAEDYQRHPSKRPPGFMWDHREGFEVKDWDDDAQVLASLREAYGAFADVLDLERILSDEIRAPGVILAEVQRYWLNQRATAAGRAVDAAEWDALADPDRVVPDGATVVLGFDGSKLDNVRASSPDTTALVGWLIEPDRPPHLFLVDVWDPAVTDHSDLRHLAASAVRMAFDRWRVAFLAGDPPHWRDEMDAWVDEYGDDRVIAFDTSSSARMGPAVERMVKEAIPHGHFTHDGNPLLRRHVLNALLVKAKRGDWLALAKPKDTEKIDSFVAATLSYHLLADVEIETAVDFVGAWA